MKPEGRYKDLQHEEKRADAATKLRRLAELRLKYRKSEGLTDSEQTEKARLEFNEEKLKELVWTPYISDLAAA